MKHNQFLLMKLMEECSEVSQRCSKLIQFGYDEVEDGYEINSHQRLQDEIYDLVSMIMMLNLNSHDESCKFDLIPSSEQFAKKQDKINRYYKYSQELGEL